MTSEAQVQNNPVINLPFLYKYGLKLTNFDVNSQKLFLGPGMCRDANNIVDIELGYSNVENQVGPENPLTIDCTINGANGLDQGSLAASTMYSIFMIADSRYYSTSSALVTLASNKIPLIPVGYDSYRLIGYWSTDSSANFNIGSYQGIGNDMIFWYNGTYTKVLNAGNATSTTPIDLTPYVPPIDGNLGIFVSNFIGEQNTSFDLFSPTANAADYFQFSQAGGTMGLAGQCTVNYRLVESSPEIIYVVSDSSSSLTLYLNGFHVSV